MPRVIYDQIPQNSYYGVTIFFVISGYLITGKFVNARVSGTQYDMRRFYIERIGRIIPPFFLLISTSFFIAIINGAKFDFSKSLDIVIYLVQFDFNIVATMLPHTESSWNTLWSLAVEETFYVFLPIVILLLVRVRFLIFAFLLIILVSFLRRVENNNDLYSFYGACGQLAIGALTSIFAPKLRLLLRPASRSCLRWAAGAMMAAIFFETSCLDGPAWCMLMAIGAAILIIAAPENAKRSSIVFRGLESLGRASYEIYLFHFMILWAVAPLDRFVPQFPSPNLAAVFLLCFAILVCYGVGLLIEKNYSQPINRFIRRSFLSPSTQLRV
jgi:peptidoglycan/LPS O-acetylase OafA/YrhL